MSFWTMRRAAVAATEMTREEIANTPAGMLTGMYGRQTSKPVRTEARTINLIDQAFATISFQLPFRRILLAFRVFKRVLISDPKDPKPHPLINADDGPDDCQYCCNVWKVAS